MAAAETTVGVAEERSRRRKDRRRRHRWKLVLIDMAILIVVVIVIAVVGYVRFRSLKGPLPTAQTVLAASATFPGSPPKLTWPAHGQAAITIGGIGSMQSGSQTPVPIASMAKVMTAYITLEDFPLVKGQSGFTVTVTPDIVADTEQRQAQAESVVPVEEGEVLTEYQLLEGLLLPSANNFATMVAVHDAGTTPAFVSKMNSTAHALHMAHTDYTDPSGFSPTTTSTASDQILLAEAAMRSPMFAEIVAEKSAVLPVAGTVKNFDPLVGTDGFTGIKTGSDSRAGGTFVFEDVRTVSGHPITMYGAVLAQDVGTNSTTALIAAATDAARKLADSVASAVSVRTVLPAGTTVAEVTNADGAEVSIVTKSALTRFGWGGMVLHLTVHTVAPGRNLMEGDSLGSVQSAGQGMSAGSDATTVVAAQSLPPLSSHWKLHHLL